MTDSPAPPSEHLDLRAYLDVLLRRWRVVAVVAIVAVVVAVGLTIQQEKVYLASADILVGQRGPEAVLDSEGTTYAQAVNATRFLNNEVEALRSGLTRDAVAADYDGPLDPDDVQIKISTTTSDLAEVSVQASDPEAAAELVNRYVEIATQLRREERTTELLTTREEIQGQVSEIEQRIAQIRQPLTAVEDQLAADPGDTNLEQRRADLTLSLASRLNPLETRLSSYQAVLENLDVTAGLLQTGGTRLLTPAEVPSEAVAPKPLRTGVLALVVGLILGVVMAYVRDALDERIREMADLERAAPGIPVFTGVPEARGEQTESFVAVRDDPKSPFAEAFRTLRTSVKFAALDEPIRVLQVTSALPGEGKTTAVANLAEAFAQGGERVAVVCCDLRRPRIHKRFGQRLGPGFTNVLLNEVSLADGLRFVHDRLYILPAGSPPPNPSELLTSGRAEAVIAALAAEFDLVLIDSTPVLPVSDALVVSRLADATLVVVDARTTKRRTLRQTMQRLTQVNAPVTGLVLNGIGPNSGAYDYTYGYGYAYGAEEQTT